MALHDSQAVYRSPQLRIDRLEVPEGFIYSIAAALGPGKFTFDSCFVPGIGEAPPVTEEALETVHAAPNSVTVRFAVPGGHIYHTTVRANFTGGNASLFVPG